MNGPRRGLCAFVASLMSLSFLATQASRKAGAGPATAGGLLPPGGFEVGQVFPEILLPSAEDGRPLSVASFRGKKTILHVFASW